MSAPMVQQPSPADEMPLELRNNPTALRLLQLDELLEAERITPEQFDEEYDKAYLSAPKAERDAFFDWVDRNHPSNKIQLPAPAAPKRKK
jgi:hypothetical protein